MPRPDSTGRTAIDVEFLKRAFELRGDTLIRRSSGHVITATMTTSVMKRADGSWVPMLIHRIKFALANGYLPHEVDHKDRNRSNPSVSNLREATRQQNNQNRVAGYWRKLPRGVYPNNKRYMAKVCYSKKQFYLGTFDTPEEASRVVEARLKVLHGDFYREQPHAPV